MYSFLREIVKIKRNRLSETKRLLSLCSPLILNKIYINEFQFNFSLKNEFNIFVEICDSFKNENFHSDILQKILDPHTPKIGNVEYLNIFLCYLSRLQKKEIGLFEKDVLVQRETYNIDILITNKKYAIIIENKINNAKDQKNQLHRYYKIVTEDLKLNLIAIVYIVPYNEKSPNLYYCDSYFKKYIPLINKKLIIMSVISHDDKYDLIHFIDECIFITQTETASVFLKHYLDLLINQAGEIIMKELTKDIYKIIYDTDDSIKLIGDIVTTWGKRDKILTGILMERILQKDIGFTNDNDQIIKRLDDNIAIALHKDSSIGYYGYAGDCFVNEVLSNSLKEVFSHNLFKFSGELYIDQRWICRRIFGDDVIRNKPMTQLEQIAQEQISILEHHYQKCNMKL